MRYLLDTHCYLWWIAAPERLSAAARAVLDDDANVVHFSAASA